VTSLDWFNGGRDAAVVAGEIERRLRAWDELAELVATYGRDPDEMAAGFDEGYACGQADVLDRVRQIMAKASE
jgi:hypothetical protein